MLHTGRQPLPARCRPSRRHRRHPAAAAHTLCVQVDENVAPAAIVAAPNPLSGEHVVRWLLAGQATPPPHALPVLAKPPHRPSYSRNLPLRLQWELPNFSSLSGKHLSEPFEIGGYSWCVLRWWQHTGVAVDWVAAMPPASRRQPRPAPPLPTAAVAAPRSCPSLSVPSLPQAADGVPSGQQPQRRHGAVPCRG